MAGAAWLFSGGARMLPAWLALVLPHPARGGRSNSGNIRPGRRLTIEVTVNL
jgi:hypothetical protein